MEIAIIVVIFSICWFIWMIIHFSEKANKAIDDHSKVLDEINKSLEWQRGYEQGYIDGYEDGNRQVDFPPMGLN